MTFSVFSTLYREAMNEPDIDMFIGSVGFPEYLGSVSGEDAYLILATIHTFANGSFRDIRDAIGASQAGMIAMLGIPARTCGNWETGVNTPPPYVKFLISWAAFCSMQER